jgi:hypothetical protein
MTDSPILLISLTGLFGFGCFLLGLSIGARLGHRAALAPKPVYKLDPDDELRVPNDRANDNIDCRRHREF